MALSVEGDKGDLIHRDDWDLENILNGVPDAVHYAIHTITLIDEMPDEESLKYEIAIPMKAIIKWHVEVIAFLRDLFGHKSTATELVTSREIILLLSQDVVDWKAIEYRAHACATVFGRKEKE